MIIAAIRDFIKDCPYLDEFYRGVNINYLDEHSSYSIEETPTEPMVKKYVDGSSIRKLDFIFTSRESYGADVLQNIENSGFYEKFSEWIESNAIKGKLPILENGKESRNLQVLTSGYALATDVDKAQYAIQLRLLYFQTKGVN